jgi:hypothetical protein
MNNFFIDICGYNYALKFKNIQLSTLILKSFLVLQLKETSIESSFIVFT